MKKIIFDTDNTIGLEGRPMDDALALLYLLGLPAEAEVIGITCNYGNGTVNEVYACTRKLLDEIGHPEMLVLRGSEQGEDARSEASRWIAATAAASPGEISYLGIGSLGNLYGAYLIDNSVFDNLKEIVLMGGITEPLFIHGDQPLAELNMSINNIASECVLSKGHNISVITGNNCLPVAELPKNEFLAGLNTKTSPVGMFIAQKSGYRFRDKELIYGADSSYCWDAVAAAYLVHPALFKKHLLSCRITADNLKTGFLNPCDEKDANAKIYIPSAIDKTTLQADFYKAWLAVDINKTETSFSCNGVYLDKLIQPAILIELSKEPAHGFLLLQRLKTAGTVDQNLDPAGFYRMLKKLEKADFLISKKTGSSPKAKQIFSITDLGRIALNNWYDTLTHYDNHIHHILNEIEQINK
ncbi:MAG: nucleoside hydrolase [Clostridiales bacterium]|nr:nucleoside hydrolase [Candidatus Crickella merdequi]